MARLESFVHLRQINHLASISQNSSLLQGKRASCTLACNLTKHTFYYAYTFQQENHHRKRLYLVGRRRDRRIRCDKMLE